MYPPNTLCHWQHFLSICSLELRKHSIFVFEGPSLSSCLRCMRCVHDPHTILIHQWLTHKLGISRIYRPKMFRILSTHWSSYTMKSSKHFWRFPRQNTSLQVKPSDTLTPLKAVASPPSFPCTHEKHSFENDESGRNATLQKLRTQNSVTKRIRPAVCRRNYRFQRCNFAT